MRGLSAVERTVLELVAKDAAGDDGAIAQISSSLMMVAAFHRLVERGLIAIVNAALLLRVSP